MEQMIVSATLRTDGSGHWAIGVKKEVEISGFTTIIWFEEDKPKFGDFRVSFNTESWDINEDSLIYTDHQFIDELKVLLSSLGLPTDNVDYSEHGMQGRDFVSFDVGSEFCEAFIVLAPNSYERVDL